MWDRPDGGLPAVTYDLLLYNAVYAGAAVACASAARRSGADRLAWRSMTVALVPGVLDNLIHTLAVAPLPEEPFPSVADASSLGYHLPLYVTLIGLIRGRVSRFHASMWLDGVVGVLGAGAVAVAVLLGPALQVTEDHLAAVLTSLAYPVADVVLLALLIGGCSSG